MKQAYGDYKGHFWKSRKFLENQGKLVKKLYIKKLRIYLR